MKNYTVYHLHTDLSLQDSATNYKDYIARAVELGQTALGYTEHGNTYNWPAKKMACEEAGLKYIHGVEVYLTEKLLWHDPRTDTDSKRRDNFHTILLAKNYEGVLEINTLVSRSYEEDHFYYKPRITFDEFFGLSKNVLKISACLASPLNKLPVSHALYDKLVKSYDYLEIQPHIHPDQVAYNRHLAQLSQQYHIPLIAGTDTHSLNQYKAECRTILQLDRDMDFALEDAFDLTYKSYDELVDLFAQQDALPEAMYLEAIENTNRMADSIEPFTLDCSIKYPILYGDEDLERLTNVTADMYCDKVERGIIPESQCDGFNAALAEELRVFQQVDMAGFMLFMHELVTWCKTHDIPVGFGRGSCSGSRVAYVTDIIDVNPEKWNTIFSRFCNSSRREIGDIDIDVAPDDREKVYDYIINRFGQERTAFILALGTIQEKDCVDRVCRALANRWSREHCYDLKPYKALTKCLRDPNSTLLFSQDVDGFAVSEDGKTASFWHEEPEGGRKELAKMYQEKQKTLKAENDKLEAGNPWSSSIAKTIKDALATDPEKVKQDYHAVFYYMDGLVGVVKSQSVHPAGIVASPITLADNYGTLRSDGKVLLQIDMDCVHEVGLAKYDILGLKNIGIIRDTYQQIGKPYPLSHEINWDDPAVWNDMLRSNVGIFQFEGNSSFAMLKQYKPTSIHDMAIVTAAIRPSAASVRNDIIARKSHRNPSKLIDDLLTDNNGFLIFQEDVIKFLQEICGFSGSEADNTRRAIGRKDEKRLAEALPKILDGYCQHSPQPREQAEKEATEFIQIISDASSYMFGWMIRPCPRENGQPGRKAKVVREPKSLRDMAIPC